MLTSRCALVLGAAVPRAVVDGRSTRQRYPRRHHPARQESLDIPQPRQDALRRDAELEMARRGDGLIAKQCARVRTVTKSGRKWMGRRTVRMAASGRGRHLALRAIRLARAWRWRGGRRPCAVRNLRRWSGMLMRVVVHMRCERVEIGELLRLHPREGRWRSGLVLLQPQATARVSASCYQRRRGKHARLDGGRSGQGRDGRQCQIRLHGRARWRCIARLDQQRCQYTRRGARDQIRWRRVGQRIKAAEERSSTRQRG